MGLVLQEVSPVSRGVRGRHPARVVDALSNLPTRHVFHNLSLPRVKLGLPLHEDAVRLRLQVWRERHARVVNFLLELISPFVVLSSFVEAVSHAEQH